LDLGKVEALPRGRLEGLHGGQEGHDVLLAFQKRLSVVCVLDCRNTVGVSRMKAQANTPVSKPAQEGVRYEEV
jgi:hypothetical protein